MPARVPTLLQFALLAAMISGLALPARAGFTVAREPEEELALRADKLARHPPACPPEAESVARALLVGDESHPDKSVKLAGPLNDVKLLHSALTSAGIPSRNVVTWVNPKPQALAEALSELLRGSRCRDRVFLYYGGFATTEHMGGSVALLKLSTLRAVVNALRNVGASVTVVFDGPMERGFLGFDESWSGPGLWTPSATIPPVLPGAGALAAFYTPVSLEQKVEGKVQGIMSFAMASVITARPDASVREVAEAVVELMRRTSPGAELRVEASDLRRPLLRAKPKRPQLQVRIDEPAAPADARGERAVVPVKAETVRLKGHVEPATPLSWVTVQNEPASLQGEGRFERDVRLLPGKNTVYVVAAAKSGDGEDPVPVAAALDVAYERPVKPRGRSYALLIGEQRYTRLPALTTPENDVREMAKLLKDQYGFETESLALPDGTRQPLTLLNQDKATIIHALYGLRKLREEDSVLIYFAGHGAREEGTDLAYWKSVRAGPEADEESVGTLELQQLLIGLPSRHVLVVSDSCYAGRMSKRDPDKPQETTAGKDRAAYLEALAASRSRWILVSGQDQPVDDEKGKGHSIFARTLLNALETMDKDAFTVVELFEEKKVGEKVIGNAPQLPDLRPIPETRHDAGRFIFVRKGKVP